MLSEEITEKQRKERKDERKGWREGHLIASLTKFGICGENNHIVEIWKYVGREKKIMNVNERIGSIIHTKWIVRI